MLQAVGVFFLHFSFSFSFCLGGPLWGSSQSNVNGTSQSERQGERGWLLNAPLRRHPGFAFRGWTRTWPLLTVPVNSWFLI